MKKNTRQLAAVMFTDMVGYTALMQEDEQKAKINRDRHRKVFEESTEDHNGVILQYYGDGTLSVFVSAIEAVECGIEIQQNLQMDPKVPLRIGIHIGDIVYTDEGIYGDAVNIASRVENLCIPGGILVSGKVFDEIKNHPEIPAKFLGKVDLKNVKLPVRVFAIEKDGIVTPDQDNFVPKTERLVKSIAVLPFVNMSSDTDNEYFSDGITEELLNALSKVDGLFVISRTSAFAFKGKNEDVRLIGKQLNVAYILEGSVRKADNRVRITSQLINTADGYHIWSEVYNRTVDDIFEVQDEISRKIANTLREKLTRSEAREKIVISPTKNLNAYNRYLQGLFYYNKWAPHNAKLAIHYFEEAINIDKEFALPYSALSMCYCLLGSTGLLPARTAFPRAKKAAIKAMALDEKLAEPYGSLAWVNFSFDLDWKGAENSHKQNIFLNPDSASAHQGYAVFLLVKEKYEEAIAEMRLAIQLDPLSYSINISFAYVYYCSRRYEDSVDQYNNTLKVAPMFNEALKGKGYVYSRMGKHDKSLKIFKQLCEQAEDPQRYIGGLGFAHAKAGNHIEAKKCLEKIKEIEQSDKNPALFIDFALIYSALEDYNRVFYYFEKAVKTKVGILAIFSNPEWRHLRSDPRFQNLYRSIKL